jgi:hypothetical protein
MVAIGPLVPLVPDLELRARATPAATAATTVSLTVHLRRLLNMALTLVGTP